MREPNCFPLLYFTVTWAHTLNNARRRLLFMTVTKQVTLLTWCLHALHLLSAAVNSTAIISSSRVSVFLLLLWFLLDLDLFFCFFCYFSNSIREKYLSTVQRTRGICIRASISTFSPCISLSLKPLGAMTLSSIIRLNPMVCQSVQEDHTHYPSCSTLNERTKAPLSPSNLSRTGWQQTNSEMWKCCCHYLQIFVPYPWLHRGI